MVILCRSGDAACGVIVSVRDTGREMPKESTTPDLVECVHRQREAANRRDIDAVMSSFAVDAVLEGRALGDFYEGQKAIRAFLDGWFGIYDDLEFKFEEIHDLGNGVVFAVVVQEGRPAGVAGHVRQREGWVYVGVGGLIARITISEVDEARAAAERLAQGRSEREQTTPAGHRIPIPAHEDFDQMVRKLAPPAGRKRPGETDEPREQSER